MQQLYTAITRRLSVINTEHSMFRVVWFTDTSIMKRSSDVYHQFLDKFKMIHYKVFSMRAYCVRAQLIQVHCNMLLCLASCLLNFHPKNMDTFVQIKLFDHPPSASFISLCITTSLSWYVCRIIGQENNSYFHFRVVLLPNGRKNVPSPSQILLVSRLKPWNLFKFLVICFSYIRWIR